MSTSVKLSKSSANDPVMELIEEVCLEIMHST